MTVVHYVNQFFAGLGAEEAAGHEPVRFDGPKGPGAGLGAAGLVVDVTLACGDDHFGERESTALATLAWTCQAILRTSAIWARTSASGAWRGVRP